jgi:hypothetical protein
MGALTTLELSGPSAGPRVSGRSVAVPLQRLVRARSVPRHSKAAAALRRLPHRRSPPGTPHANAAGDADVRDVSHTEGQHAAGTLRGPSDARAEMVPLCTAGGAYFRNPPAASVRPRVSTPRQTGVPVSSGGGAGPDSRAAPFPDGRAREDAEAEPRCSGNRRRPPSRATRTAAPARSRGIWTARDSPRALRPGSAPHVRPGDRSSARYGRCSVDSLLSSATRSVGIGCAPPGPILPGRSRRCALTILR